MKEGAWGWFDFSDSPQLPKGVISRFCRAHRLVVVLTYPQRHDTIVQKLQEELVYHRRMVLPILPQNCRKLLHRQVRTQAFGSTATDMLRINW